MTVIKRVTFVLVMGVVLAACMRLPTTPEPVAVVATQAEALATATPLPATDAPTATPTPPPTFTPQVTNTIGPTSTPLPTNTPPPTFTPEPAATNTPALTNTPEVTQGATAEPTEAATEEADPTAAPTAQATNQPTAEPTTAPTTTPAPPQPTVEPGTNLFANPGFEGPTSPIGFTEINIVEGWGAFYCDDPYVPGGCPAPQPCQDGTASGCNEEGLMQGRPEFKRAVEPDRHRSGEAAQQWFCYYRTCSAGVYQTINTAPGQTCTVSAWVRTWSNWEGGVGSPSDGLDTLDGQANSTWLIKVDLTGGEYAFGSGLIQSAAFGYAAGHYDNWAQISFTFNATGSRTTIFFQNARLWPIENNDSFIDDAFVSCQ